MMSDIQHLQEEIRLLKEREASLQRQLMLERERRLHAEKIIQNEKNACLELKSLLEQQDKKFRATIALPPTQLNSNYCIRDRAISVSEVPKMMTDQQRTIIMPESDLTDSAPSLLQQQYRRSRSHTGNRTVDVQQQARGVRSQSAKLGNRRITIDNSDMYNSAGDFATSVFTELPEDLQEILSPSLGEEEPHTNQLMRLAVEGGNDKELLQLLKQHGLVSDPVNDDGSTLLHVAAIKGQLRCVKVLMDWGMDPNQFRKGQVTPLMDACASDHLDCMKLLLERGGNYKLRDAKGWNALYWASSKGSLSCVQFLLEHSLEYGDFLIEMAGGTSTVLHVAVESRQPAILHVLLTHLTANYGVGDSKGSLTQLVNAKDKHGSTPAHVAAGVGCTDCLELLCACSVIDLSVKDQWSRMAIDVATAECKEILANRDCQEVLVALDLSEDTEPLVHTIINTIHVFKYHRWADFDVLVGDALALHCQDLCKRNLSTRCKPLSGCSSAGSLAGLPNGSGSSTNSPTSTRKHKVNRKSSPLEIIEEMVPAYSNLGLGTTSICNYKVGLVTWLPGESPPSRHEDCDTPFTLFHSRFTNHSTDHKLPVLYVKLQGTENGRLDQLSYETMIPLDTLQGYLELLEKSQCVIVHGPHGCGKTYLSRHLAKCLLKCKNGDPLSGLVHISLHPNFKRDDLLRLFHIHGALVAASGSNEGNLTSSEGSQSSLQNSTLSSNGEHSRSPKVFLLDDIDRVTMPEVIGELLNAFHHRGPSYPVWVDTVQSRTRDICYHANHYYLRSDCYFIATVTTTGHSREFNRPFHETFMHIWLSTNKEPVTGILHRQLMRKLIHTYDGQVPHHNDPVYAAVQWISEVWQLLNYYINKMGLLEVLAGPRHFLYCPVERNRPDFVYKWLIELWNHQLVPMIRDVTVYGTPLSHGGRQDTTAQILTTLTQRAIKPTCPLENEATLQFLCQLEGGQEGINMIEDAKKSRRNLTPSPRAEQRIQTSPGKSRWGSNSPLVHQRKHSIEDHHIHVKQTSDSSVDFGHSNGVLSDSPGSTLDRIAQRLVATPESNSKQLVPIDERYGEIAYNRNTSHSSSSTTDKESELPIVKTPGSEKKRNRFGRMLGKFSRDKKINDGSPSMKGSSKRSTSLSSEVPGKQDQIQGTPKADFDDFFDMVLKATSERIDDQRTAAPNISFYSRSLESSSKTMTSHSLPDLLQDDSSEEISDTMAEVHPIAVTRSSTALHNKNNLLQQQDMPRTDNNKRNMGLTHSLHLDTSMASAELLNNSYKTLDTSEAAAVSKSETHLSGNTSFKFATSPSMARMDLLLQDAK